MYWRPCTQGRHGPCVVAVMGPSIRTSPLTLCVGALGIGALSSVDWIVQTAELHPSEGLPCVGALLLLLVAGVGLWRIPRWTLLVPLALYGALLHWQVVGHGLVAVRREASQAHVLLRHLQGPTTSPLATLWRIS